MSETFSTSGQSSAEDRLCIRQIARAKEDAEFVKQSSGDVIDLDIQPEKHYNYYGDRGVADLFIRRTQQNGYQEDRVYEYKSESAVQSSTGANEILRQFNRMCSYFYKDETINPPKASTWDLPDVTFYLIFEATPITFEHVIDNYEIYNSINAPVVQEGLRNTRSIAMFRHPEKDGPVLIATDNDDNRLNRDEVAKMAIRDFGESINGRGVF